MSLIRYEQISARPRPRRHRASLLLAAAWGGAIAAAWLLPFVMLAWASALTVAGAASCVVGGLLLSQFPPRRRPRWGDGNDAAYEAHPAAFDERVAAWRRGRWIAGLATVLLVAGLAATVVGATTDRDALPGAVTATEGDESPRGVAPVQPRTELEHLLEVAAACGAQLNGQLTIGDGRVSELPACDPLTETPTLLNLAFAWYDFGAADAMADPCYVERDDGRCVALDDLRHFVLQTLGEDQRQVDDAYAAGWNAAIREAERQARGSGLNQFLLDILLSLLLG